MSTVPTRFRSSHSHNAQDRRPALAQRDAAGADPVGQTRLGAARADRAGAVRALQPRARTAPQAADRLGAPDAPASAPLAAGAQPS